MARGRQEGDTVDLVRTKLEPPLDPGSLVSRPRLQARLDDAAKTKLTLIQAPAGYGKSCVLSQWFHQLRGAQFCVGWLSIDSADQEPVGLLTYVAAALAAAGVSFKSAVNRASGGDVYTKYEPLLAAIVNELEQAGQPVFVFLDDTHLLPTASLAVLHRLIECSPLNVHFVFASRVIVDMPLARMRANGQLLELGVEDLRFTREELQRFMSSGGQVVLGEPEYTVLEERTEGWIAGIKLARLALRQEVAPKELLASFTGSRRSVSDFFAEEVIGLQSAEVREFLLTTCVLERLSPELCNAVTRQKHGRQMLSFVERSGLFLLRLDDERTWYRYQHLFAEFLVRRLREADPCAESELHLRASHWFWERNFHVEAIEHALKAKAPERAAELLELCCQDLTYSGKLQFVSRFAARIPEEILHRQPRTLLNLAWLLTRNLRFEETRALLDVVIGLLDRLESADQLPANELRGLRHLLSHREMMLAASHDDAIQVDQQCRQLIDAFPEETHLYLAGTIYTQLLYAQREQYQLGELERLTAKAQGILARSSYSFASIALQACIGPSLFFAGKTDAAVRALEQGLAEGIRFGGRYSALAALPALPLSEIMYEGNDLDRAEQLIQDSLPYATELGFVDQLMPGYMTHARIRRARGDLPGALQALDVGMGIALERRLERLRLALVCERVKFMVQAGDIREAIQFAHSAGIPESSQGLLPRRPGSTAEEWRALTWCRLALSENQLQDALSLARQWRSFCATRGAVRSLVRWDLLIAQALLVRGDHLAARRALREAITHAAASRLVRTFIDEGPPIRTLLESAYDSNLEVLHPTDAFASELLETFAHPGSKSRSKSPPAAAAAATVEGLYGKFSPKEREILSLVSSGMRNREVAQKLGMTEGSVKWYMQQVYDKIGTRRRLQAVERARRFGMIA
jgi:LuxR family maltose regulon positive regulatory protein